MARKPTPLIRKEPATGYVFTVFTPPPPSLGSTNTTTYAGLNRWTSRAYSGYLGAKVKPLKRNPHAYSLNKQDISFRRQYNTILQYGSNGQVLRREYGYGPGLNSNFSGVTVNGSFAWTHLDNQALSTLNEKLRGELDLSISLFQARQTGMTFRPVDRILHYTKKFTSALTRKSWREFVSTVSSARLEYMYGVKPLMSDMYNILNQDPLISQDSAISVESYAKDDGFKPTSVTLNTTVGTVQFPISECNFRMKTKYGMTVATSEHDLARWTSLNPLSIAWELLPYSFVVDWVYNVGGYLRDCETSYLGQTSFICGWKTRISRGSADIYHASGFWAGEFEFLDIVRTVLPSYPYPYPPVLKVEMGSGRLLNAAALLGVMLRR